MKKNERLPELQVKQITPDELPDNMILKLNLKYKVQLPEFTIITNDEKGFVYVRKGVLTDEEIENIIKAIEWPDNGIFDETTEIGNFFDYTIEKYGWPFNRVLYDAHAYRLKFKRTQKAKEQAKRLAPFLLDYDDTLPTLCYKELVEEIGSQSKSLLVDLGYAIAKGIVSVNEKTLRIKKQKGSEEVEAC